MNLVILAMCDSQAPTSLGQVTWVEKLGILPCNLIPTLEAPSTAISELAPKLAVPETTEVAPEMSVDAVPEKGTKGREELTS